ncbi:MAG: glutamine--fructose-6-phosphate transaminase (isomerizing) [Candidatus Omnitrophica bacterium]|nr:glutamine--fructose-6-phosphate transaminase (isomerizing) [Candidatus Omnitrophota bacterium]
MCGIVGYIGKKDASPLLLSALKHLEYRGYDSCGIGVISQKENRIFLKKTPGKILNLSNILEKKSLPLSHLGISHTRWATHGKPTKPNAHPHADQTGKILIVHNGIIENYQELKSELQQKGYKFVSETDSEVIAHLISSFHQGDLLKAVQKTIRKLDGSFALGIISSDFPDRLIAARLGSPLIIGVGHEENFIASDVSAVLDRTRRIIYLKDGEVAEIKKDSLRIFDFEGRRVTPKIQTVNFEIESVQKGGFPHFMLKEIHEQAHVLTTMLSSRLKDGHVHLEGISLSEKELKEIQKIIIVACGTAYHAGLVGEYIIEQLAGVPVGVEFSSEFRYRSPIIRKNTLVIAISQSGETADTVGSTLMRESHGVLYTHAGPEIGVASTKAYTAQVCMMYLFAIKLSLARKSISLSRAQEIIRSLKDIPLAISSILRLKQKIAKVAHDNAHFGSFLFLGRNLNYPSALEGALKLKEISYIPAEGYASGEMKHGPIALIDEYRAVVCLAPESDTYEKMISNIQEIRARKGKIIAIATEGDLGIKQHAHNVIYVPAVDRMLTPLVVIIPLQLLAYYIAAQKGNDVDQPRNLAKSVTVE